jgi:hypothetical protein
MQDFMQNNVQNLSRLNVTPNVAPQSSSNFLSSIPLPVIVLVILYFVKNMIPVELRKTVSAPMVAGGAAAILFYNYRSNMTMAAMYAVVAYYVLYSMAPVEEKENKAKQ